MTQATPIFIRVASAPTVLGVSRSTIYNWANAGAIKIHKRGGCAFLRVSEVIDYISGVGDQLGDRGQGPD